METKTKFSTKYDKKTVDQVIYMLKIGVPIKDISEIIGVKYDTIKSWIAGRSIWFNLYAKDSEGCATPLEDIAKTYAARDFKANSKKFNPSSYTDKENIYYVYVHKSKKDGSVFYVGKGCGDRLNSRVGRNRKWLDIVSKDGYTAEVMQYFKSEEEAVSFEGYLLEQNPMGWNLCNVILKKKENYDYTKIDWNLFVRYDESSPSFLVWNFSGDCANKSNYGRFSGDVAGYASDQGYWKIKLFNRDWFAHRIIYLLHDKINYSNDLVVNHIDGIRNNNNIKNLEMITIRQNNNRTKRQNFSVENNSPKQNLRCIYLVKRSRDKGGEFWAFRCCISFYGETLTRSFPFSKYGYVDAFKLAIHYRDEVMALERNSHTSFV